MSHLPGSDRELTSHNNFILRSSENSLDLVLGYPFEVYVILGGLASMVTHLIENWTL